MKNTLIAILGCLILFSCKNKEIVIPPFEAPETDRVILLEEFTGVRCPNCPKGQVEIENLMARFPGKIIAVGVHSFLLAQPLPDSKYDFRTLEAQELQNFHGASPGKPSVVINRKTHDIQGAVGKFIPDTDLWSGVVESELESFSKITVEQENIFDVTSRMLDINVSVTAKSDISTPVYLNIMITESHIIDPQDDNGVKIPDYEHNHVMREIITEVQGGDLFANSLEQDVQVDTSYSFQVPPEDGLWVAENLEVVVFFTTEIDGEVNTLQASHKKIE